MLLGDVKEFEAADLGDGEQDDCGHDNGGSHREPDSKREGTEDLEKVGTTVASLGENSAPVLHEGNSEVDHGLSLRCDGERSNCHVDLLDNQVTLRHGNIIAMTYTYCSVSKSRAEACSVRLQRGRTR